MMLQDFLFYIILPILCLSMVLIFFRFVKGPSIVDRVISLDLLITCGLGIIAAFSIMTDRSTFLDIAMILALIAFLGTVAFAYYLIKRHKNE